MKDESIIRKVLKSEASTIVAVVLATVGFVGWIQASDNKTKEELIMVKNRLEVIENNHLTHMQASMEKLEKKSEQNDLDHREIDKKLERILVILEKQVDN